MPVVSLVLLDPRPDELAPIDGGQRRKMKRQARKFESRTRERPITLADVPAGSILSDSTLAAIASGRYGVQVIAPKPAPPPPARPKGWKAPRLTPSAQRRQARRLIARLEAAEDRQPSPAPRNE